jgi:hypothetical protein
LLRNPSRLVSSVISAKDRVTHGNPARIVLRVLVIMVLVTSHAHVARGDGCPPAVALTGDDAAVRAVRAQLDARGIAGETPSCPALHAALVRRGAQIIVSVERGARAGMPAAVPGGEPGDVPGDVIERAVGEPVTAATVIESWVRSDVAAPLLEIRAVPAAEVEAAAAPSPATSGIQLFGGLETSFASDRTVWEGMELGVGVLLGRVCAAARIHGGRVIATPGGWSGFARKGGALYVGVDVPIAVGHNRLSPGFAAGYGTMLTRHRAEGDGDGEGTTIEISGPRAEAHVAFTIPLSRHLALELATSAELTQATGMETHGELPSGAVIVYPDEPRALFRFAVGVRYGAL